jgi:hypothetical protein
MASRSRYPVPPMLRHTLLLGDWSRWVRDPIDVLRLTFLVGFVAAAVSGDLGGAFRLGVTAVFVYLARWIAVPRLFDLGFVLGMALQGWGNVFNLFESISWWDTLVHFVLSFWAAPLFYIGLARLGVVPDLAESEEPHPYLGIFIVTMALGLSFGALYEIYEWVVDQFGAHLYISERDTVKDLATDAAGSALGGLLLMLWAERGWRTVRRVPARRLEGLGNE